MIEDADESAINIFENLKTVINKSGLQLHDFTSIGANKTNVNMGNNRSVYSLFHDLIENPMKGRRCNKMKLPFVSIIK